MPLVQVGADRTLKAVSQKSAGKLAANIMHLIRRGLAGLKALDNVIHHIAAVQRLAPPAFGCLHSFVGVLRNTVKAGHIQLMLSFILVLRVVNQPLHIGRAQIFRLLRIGCVIQAAL